MSITLFYVETWKVVAQSSEPGAHVNKARLKKAFLDRGSGTLIKVFVYLVLFNCPSVLVLEVFGIYFGCTPAALRCM